MKGNNGHFFSQDITLARDQVGGVAVHTHLPTLATALAQTQTMVGVVPTIPHTKVRMVNCLILHCSKFYLLENHI